MDKFRTVMWLNTCEKAEKVKKKDIDKSVRKMCTSKFSQLYVRHDIFAMNRIRHAQHFTGSRESFPIYFECNSQVAYLCCERIMAKNQKFMAKCEALTTRKRAANII